MHEIKYNPFNKEFLVFFDGEEAGYLHYQTINDTTWDITHTVVFPNYRGKSLARHLVEAAVAEAQKQGITLTASCDYAEKVIAG